MSNILNKLPLSELVADGEVHCIEQKGITYIYEFSLEPTVVFSFGVLTDDGITHWYESKTFSTSIEWLSYCRAILREPLKERKILSAGKSINQMQAGLNLIKRDRG